MHVCPPIFHENFEFLVNVFIYPNNTTSNSCHLIEMKGLCVSQEYIGSDLGYFSIFSSDDKPKIGLALASRYRLRVASFHSGDMVLGASATIKRHDIYIDS